MAADFRQACPNVRELSVDRDFDGVWMGAFAAQLENLEVVSDFPVPKECTSPAELNYCKIIRDANVPVNWEFYGGNLESLVIHRTKGFLIELDKLRKHCRKLKHIDLSGVQRAAHTADFLASCGDQLEFIGIYNMKERDLELIANKSTKARFDAIVLCDEHLLLQTLKILGPPNTSTQVL